MWHVRKYWTYWMAGENSFTRLENDANSFSDEPSYTIHTYIYVNTFVRSADNRTNADEKWIFHFCDTNLLVYGFKRIILPSLLTIIFSCMYNMYIHINTFVCVLVTLDVRFILISKKLSGKWSVALLRLAQWVFIGSTGKNK